MLQNMIISRGKMAYVYNFRYPSYSMLEIDFSSHIASQTSTSKWYYSEKSTLAKEINDIFYLNKKGNRIEMDEGINNRDMTCT